jgi:hypothetical protein
MKASRCALVLGDGADVEPLDVRPARGGSSPASSNRRTRSEAGIRDAGRNAGPGVVDVDPHSHVMVQFWVLVVSATEAVVVLDHAEVDVQSSWTALQRSGSLAVLMVANQIAVVQGGEHIRRSSRRRSARGAWTGSPCTAAGASRGRRQAPLTWQAPVPVASTSAPRGYCCRASAARRGRACSWSRRAHASADGTGR